MKIRVKNIIVLLSLLMISSTLYAEEAVKDTIIFSRTCKFEDSIDILGFEKRLKDKNELYIVRNNTNHTITLINLRVFYKTTNDEMLDYRDVTLRGEFLPQTTKQFEVESFDKGKRYYYYESPDQNPKLEGYPFKITYELLRYDIAVT
ncbi:MAG: hypothetical protein J6R61_05975, partial [Bacteroidales bacterium]|nr:hypothetical protein [Bacteroidales bacterium]